MTMRIAVSGASGFLGRALVASLEADGHGVVRLVRRLEPGDVATWNPATGAVDAEALEGVDAVVHLAGEDISSGRWTTDKKRRIRQSRVAGTTLLARTVAGLRRPPAVMVSAAAVGVYGDRGDEVLTEASVPGTGFLAELAQDWEGATAPATAAGVSVVLPRFGIILDPEGGALARMLLPFRLGIGGPLGSGAQWVSWLTRAEAVRIIRFALETPAVSGPVNAVAPAPVTFRELAATLGAVLHRPAVLPVPAIGLRLLFGEMADALLLASQRCEPAVLQRAGYRFLAPELRGALADLLRPDG